MGPYTTAITASPAARPNRPDSWVGRKLSGRGRTSDHLSNEGVSNSSRCASDVSRNIRTDAHHSPRRHPLRRAAEPVIRAPVPFDDLMEDAMALLPACVCERLEFERMRPAQAPPATDVREVGGSARRCHVQHVRTGVRRMGSGGGQRCPDAVVRRRRDRGQASRVPTVPGGSGRGGLPLAVGGTTVIAICTCTARLMSLIQQVNRLCGKCCSSPTSRTPPRWRASTSSVHWNAAAATDVATGVGDQPQEMGRVRESASTADVQDLVENLPHG